MPINPNLEPKSHSFPIMFGQKPLTRFTDYRKAIKVDLIKYDDPSSMLKGTYDFIKATWSEDGRDSERATISEMQEALNQMLSGKALQLGLETVNFIFRISGITRIDTHQIVRQRVGVTFSQMCSGDQWWSHRDCLVEESIAQDENLLASYMATTLSAKNCYTEMIDSQKVSIQAAREILPQNLDTFIFMKIDLSTLLFFYKKRIDNESQTWSINEIARQMQEEVCKVYPELQSTFDKMKGSFDFQKKASADRKNTFSTSLYIPEKDEFDYVERDFLYPKTKSLMNFTGTPIRDDFYWGYQRVSEDQYKSIKRLYDDFNLDVKKNHWTNGQILEKAEHLNLFIKSDILYEPRTN